MWVEVEVNVTYFEIGRSWVIVESLCHIVVQAVSQSKHEFSTLDYYVV